MLQLHPPTLLVATATLSTTVCVFFLINWLSRPGRGIYFWMGMAGLFGSLGCAVLLLRDLAPASLLVGVAQGCLIANNALVLAGIQSFDRRKVSVLSLFGGVAIWGVALCIPAVHASMAARVVLASLLCTYYYGRITFNVLSGYRAESFASRATVGGFSLLHMGFCMARIPLFAFQSSEPGFQFLEQPASGIALLEAMFNIVTMSLAITVMECSRAEREQRKAASTDGLTGVLNRRAFIEHATTVVEHARQPAALILFDLDHFKRINDTAGHAAGDLALVAFARLLGQHMETANHIAQFAADAPLARRKPVWFKSEDTEAPEWGKAFFGRIGGEEFACLLPGLTAAQAAVVADDIRRSYRRLNLRIGDQTIVTSVSAGVISTREARRAVDILLAEADRALYVAKKKGRDRVEIGEMRTILSAVANTA